VDGLLDEGGRSILFDSERGVGFSFAGPCRPYILCNWRVGCHHREHSGQYSTGPCGGNGGSNDHRRI
jgi:hypothetical protein